MVLHIRALKAMASLVPLPRTSFCKAASLSLFFAKY